MPLLSLFENLKLNDFEILCENTYIRRSKKRSSSKCSLCLPRFFSQKKSALVRMSLRTPICRALTRSYQFRLIFNTAHLHKYNFIQWDLVQKQPNVCTNCQSNLQIKFFNLYVFGHMDSLIKEVEMEGSYFRTMFHISICKYIKEKFWLIAIFNIQINYFLDFSRVVTLISLLAARPFHFLA